MSKKFYLIYKITNNVNQKFYIGKHETNNLDDDYFGSGKHLNNAKEKYGLENFTKTILFYCQSREEMNLLEHYVVTPEFCQREDVYNIMEGGNGGWDYVNLSSDYAIGSENRKQKMHGAGGKACQEKYKKEYGSFTTYVYKNMDLEKREALRKLYVSIAQTNPKFDWTGKKHKPETIQKMKGPKPKITGEKNGNFGNVWVNDPILEESFPWPKDVELPSIYEYGRVIDFNTKRQQLADKQMNKIAKQEHNVKLKELQQTFFTAFYDVYLTKGFDSMCEQFGLIDLSQSAFCHLCKKRVLKYKKYNRWHS